MTDPTPLVTRSLGIGAPGSVGEARRAARAIAEQVGLGETDAERAAIIATELGTNVERHAVGGSGELLLRPLTVEGVPGLDVLCLDGGPGIESIERAMRDGWSSGGGAGIGLGGVRRQSDVFDLGSDATGTVVLARVLARGRAGRAADTEAPWGELGAVDVPKPGEPVSGDRWAIRHRTGQTLLLVADGIGHGAAAGEAAGRAVRCFLDSDASEPEELLQRMHEATRGSRGAVAAVAGIEHGRSTLSFAGVGNIFGHLLHPDAREHLLSSPGTLGSSVGRVHTGRHRWGAGSRLILASDGLTSRFDAELLSLLRFRHPGVTAARLYRDHFRGSDDATVVVLGDPETVTMRPGEAP